MAGAVTGGGLTTRGRLSPRRFQRQRTQNAKACTDSSSRNIRPVTYIMIGAWKCRARCVHGRCRKAHQRRCAKHAWPCMWKIIPSIMPILRARSRLEITGQARLTTYAVWAYNLYYMDETHSQDRVQSAKERLKKAVDDLHSASKAKAAQFQTVVEDTWSDAQSRAQTWQTEIGAYIQQNPTKAVFMALGVGFVFSRRLWK